MIMQVKYQGKTYDVIDLDENERGVSIWLDDGSTDGLQIVNPSDGEIVIVR